MGIFGTGSVEIENLHIPQHIAIIMDGNGRWAKKRGLSRTVGHKAGSENFKTIARYCHKIGVKHLTVYAFSTENWRRPTDEIRGIMNLFEQYLQEACSKLKEENIKVRILGDTSKLSAKLQNLISTVHEKSDDLDSGMTANICINYGGRDEILNAIKIIVKAVEDSGIKAESICEKIVSDSLYTKGVPDPDIIIRPGGEIRISNFLIWQCAYSELYFTDVLWPDFNEKELNKAIVHYNKRNRRFGGI